MTWKKKAAQVSGATLGYIHGNIAGAVGGYNLAGHAYDWRFGTKSTSPKMQTPSSSRRRKQPRTRSVSRGRTKSRAPSSMRSKSTPSHVRSVSRRTGSSARSLAVGDRIEGSEIRGGVAKMHKTINLSKGKHGKYKKDGGTVSLQDTYQVLVPRPTRGGYQAVDCIGDSGNYTQLTSNNNTGGTYNKTSVALFGLHPNSSLTGGMDVGGTATFGTPAASDRNYGIIHNSTDFEIDLVNLCNITQYYKIIVGVSKRHQSKTAPQVFNDLKAGGAPGYSGAAVTATGGPAAPANAAGWLDYGFVGCNLYDIPAVKSFWKLQTVADFCLAPGANEKIHLHVKRNKMLMYNLIVKAATTYVAGESIQIWVQCHGQPVVDDTTGTHVMAYGSTEYGVIVRRLEKITPISTNKSKYELLSYDVGAPLISNQHFMGNNDAPFGVDTDQ